MKYERVFLKVRWLVKSAINIYSCGIFLMMI